MGDTSKNSELLRRNLGGTVGDEMDAHHLIHSTNPDAADLRQLLDEYQIDINSAANGILIPRALHQKGGLHTNAVLSAIGTRLETKTLALHKRPDAFESVRQTIIDELNGIGSEIVNGEFP